MQGKNDDPPKGNGQTIKKRSRSTKKSLAAENDKRQRHLSLLKCDSLPPYVAEILKQEESEKGHILKLSDEEVDRLWCQLEEFVGKLLSADEDSEVLRAVVSLLQHTATLHNATNAFTQAAVTLNLALTHQKIHDKQLLNEICELSEFCCKKELHLPGEFYLDTFYFLFGLTLNEDSSDKKPEVKRMWDMRVALARINLRTSSCEPLVAKLIRTVVSPVYLACKEGRQFIAFCFTLDTKLIKKFHQAVKDFLPQCKRNQAVAYGDVYYSAWTNSSPEGRQMLESQCIQNFMSHMFVMRRKGIELTHLGHNVFAILSYLHQQRIVSHFSKILTELYMPLLWRYLRSGNNIERCNAAEVFLDVYPLEKPGSGKAEESDFFNKQHNEMVDLLTDRCHFLRIIAIKGVCKKMCSAWGTFPQETVQVLMRNLVALANDGSYYGVRRALYEGLGLMLLNPESAVYVARMLPSLRDYIHDHNEKVRCAFVKLLINVKEMPEAPIKYWKIVPVDHLAVRLELESAEVGSVLAKLLMSNIFSSRHNMDKFLFLLIKFIETSPIAARRLFQFSIKVLVYEDAIRVMMSILLSLRQFVKKKLEGISEVPEEEEKGLQPRLSKRKKKRSLQPLQPIIENDQNVTESYPGASEEKENNSSAENQLDSVSDNSSAKSEQETVEEFSKPGVSHALIDIVSLLWGLHSKTLAHSDHEDEHNNLLDVACAGIPLFLKYYKGSPTYFAVIHLANFVPAVKLTPVSTVVSACVSHLRQISEMTPQAEMHVIIHALCSWNRFAEIQDMVVDWLDQAFRCEGLNQSKAPEEDFRQRKVRFVARGGKPMLALKLLDTIFIHSLNSKRVMSKSYNQVHELYVYLERIKVLVERRLLGGLPLDSPMLTDEFILKCFYRYCKLILLLHRPEPNSSTNQTVIEPFDASQVFRQFIQWVSRVIRPMIPQRLEEEPDFSVLLLRDILRTGANLVDLMYATSDTVISLATLVKDLLSSESRLWYVEPSLMVVKHVKDFSEAQYGFDDNAQLMRLVVPSLLSQALKSVSDFKYSKEQIAACVQNVNELKGAMWEVMQCLYRMYGPHSPLLRKVLALFTDALVALIVHDVRQLMLLDLAEKIQDLPFACSLLISVVSRPPLPKLWLDTVPNSISQLYSQDGCLLVATVSLLYTLAHCCVSMPKQELGAAVRTAFTTVSSYTRDSTSSSDTSDSGISNDHIDVKKVSIPVLTELAAFLNCPLR